MRLHGWCRGPFGRTCCDLFREEGISLQDLRWFVRGSPNDTRWQEPGRHPLGRCDTARWGRKAPTSHLREASKTIFPLLPDLVETKWVDHLGARKVDQLQRGARRTPVPGRPRTASLSATGGQPDVDPLALDRWRRRSAISSSLTAWPKRCCSYTLEHESASEIPLTMAAKSSEGDRRRGAPKTDWCGARVSRKRRWRSSPAGANARA